jgi:hypothetical protein
MAYIGIILNKETTVSTAGQRLKHFRKTENNGAIASPAARA